jgi:hypothetical protein
MARSKAWKSSVRRSKVTGGVSYQGTPRLSGFTGLEEQTSLRLGSLVGGSDETPGGRDFLEGQPRSGPAESHISLIDRAASGTLQWKPKFISMIAVLLWFGFASWLYLQDNAAGKLEDWNGYEQFGRKIGFHFLFLLVCVGLITLLGKLFDWRSSPD